MSPEPDRKPGQFADARFRARRAAWRRRAAPYVLAGAALVVLATMGAALIAGADLTFYAGVALGTTVTMLIALLDTPPHHIERWRTGAEGERQTARAARPLTRRGWVLLNDLPLAYGNIDHVLIGPPGVFLLETKNLSGTASVSADTLHVRWLEDPDDGYSNTAIGPRARGAAARLSAEVAARIGRRPWVQSVVVLWTPFEQGVVEEQRVLWLHGDRLAETLLDRAPARLDAEAIRRAADAVRQSTVPEVAT